LKIVKPRINTLVRHIAKYQTYSPEFYLNPKFDELLYYQTKFEVTRHLSVLEDQIKKNGTLILWEEAFNNNAIPEEFIQDNRNNLDWGPILLYYPNITKEFVEKYANYISGGIHNIQHRFRNFIY
jgi:hypothetical protein